MKRAPGSGGAAELRLDSDWEESVERQTGTAFLALRRDAWLNFGVRIALYAVGLAAIVIALSYTSRRGDDMVGELLDIGQDTHAHFHAERLLALTVPLILLVLAAVSLGCALVVQSRGSDDFESALGGISRLRREAQAGVSRSRDTSHVLEEFVVNVRRALRLQLWLTRTLFLISILLFAVAVADAVIEGVDLGTVALGGGILVGLLAGMLSGAATSVGTHLSDATQLQIVVSNTTRQVNVVEELMFKVMEVRQANPETAQEIISSGVTQITQLTDRAVELIQLYTEPRRDGKAESGEPAPTARRGPRVNGTIRRRVSTKLKDVHAQTSG